MQVRKVKEAISEIRGEVQGADESWQLVDSLQLEIIYS